MDPYEKAGEAKEAFISLKGWEGLGPPSKPPSSVSVGSARLTRVGIFSLKGESYRLPRANIQPTATTKAGIMCPFVKFQFTVF